MTQVFNRDCMEAMKEFSDKFFDLAIVDPPYGGGQHFNFRYGTGDLVYDSHKPDPAYFIEIRRISKNQIVWGGNYFTDCLPVNRCWISWSKSNPAPNFSDFELAWTSFDKVSSELRLESYGFNHADKRNGEKSIHPTQKPVALYKWLLSNYATCKYCHNLGGYYEDVAGDGGSRMWVSCEECDCANGAPKILDTHLGSGSSRIAADDMGFDFWGYEIDKDYFDASVKRFNDYKSQQKLFP